MFHQISRLYKPPRPQTQGPTTSGDPRVSDDLETVYNRVVPIPIPVSDIPPILPKMQHWVSVSMQVYAPIRYHHYHV